MSTRRGARRADRTRAARGRLAPRSPGYLPRSPGAAQLAQAAQASSAGYRATGRPIGPRPDPRALLAVLRRRVTAGAVVAFGAFFGLAAVNVVGVTAHGGAGSGAGAGSGSGSGSGAAAVNAATPTPAPTAVPTLAPGDFFGRAGAPVAGAAAGNQVAAPVAPPLVVGGGAPMVSTGGS